MGQKPLEPVGRTGAALGTFERDAGSAAGGPEATGRGDQPVEKSRPRPAGGGGGADQPGAGARDPGLAPVWAPAAGGQPDGPGSRSARQRTQNPQWSHHQTRQPAMAHGADRTGLAMCPLSAGLSARPPVAAGAAQSQGGGGAKNKAIVAIGRRLAIDLWRINTGRTTKEKLGLK